MFRTVTGAGSLLLRGLGPSGLLVSRGLGGPFTLVIEFERPRQLRVGGGSSQRIIPTIDEVRCVFVTARLVTVNDRDVIQPIENEIKVCYGIDRFKVTSTLPTITKRFIKITAKLINKSK